MIRYNQLFNFSNSYNVSIKGVTITKGLIGATASVAAASISALIANGVAVAGKLVLGTHYTLYSVDDAAALGIDATYDTTNSVLVHHHIAEFYRMAGAGTELHLMVVAQAILPGTILDDATNIYARKLVASAQGAIRQLAIAFNPAAGYEETVTDGFNSDIRASIVKAQAFYGWCDETERPLQILLEGRSYSGNETTAINLKQLEIAVGVDLEADKVSIVIAQDYNHADTLWALGKKYASVGLLLGTVARIRVNQSIGEVETLNLTDAVKGKYTVAGLSSHTKVVDVEASLTTLDTKGYIVAGLYTGLSGYRWNWGHVCAPEKEDAEGRLNESTIEYGRTLDDTRRRLRIALLPKVKTVQPVDPVTGKLPMAIVRAFEAIGDNVFADMVAEGIISGGKTIVNPDSNLHTGDRALEVNFIVVPTGTIKEMAGSINLKIRF